MKNAMVWHKWGRGEWEPFRVSKSDAEFLVAKHPGVYSAVDGGPKRREDREDRGRDRDKSRPK